MIHSIIVDDTFDLKKTMECGQCFHYERLRENKYRVYGLNSVCEIEQANQIIFLYTNENELDYWRMYFTSLLLMEKI